MFFKNIYANKKVLITGHTGFKGSWLFSWLKLLKADVYGVSKDIPTNPSHFKELDLIKNNNFFIDLKEKKKIQLLISKIKPDFIFHLAAQSIVSKSYIKPFETWQTNVIGTLNLLDAVLKIRKRCNLIIVTSDKCYYNYEKKIGYKEIDPLGGKDNYSASKASCEILVKSYFESFIKKKKNLRICTARAGNVIGGGDWTKDRLIPDVVKSWVNYKTPVIRNLKSTRPWQHVLEALSGYLTLGLSLQKNSKLNGESFNFGPTLNKSFKVDYLLNNLRKYFRYNKIPKKNKNFLKETRLLSLNSNKAKKLLKWKQNLNFDQTIKMVGEWYQDFYYSKKKICTLKQIDFYQREAKRRGIFWAT